MPYFLCLQCCSCHNELFLQSTLASCLHSGDLTTFSAVLADVAPLEVHINYQLIIVQKMSFILGIIIIGPESDHCLPLSLTDSLTHSCLVNFIDVTLVCEDANSKLVEVVTVADVVA